MKGIRVVIEVDPTESWATPGETLEGLCEQVAHLARVNGAVTDNVRVRVDCGGLGGVAMKYMQDMHGIVCETLPKRPRPVRREW